MPRGSKPGERRGGRQRATPNRRSFIAEPAYKMRSDGQPFFVRKLGSKNLPETAPTTLSAMAYEIARGVLDQYPTIKKIEVHLVHFSKGLETKEESEDNHVVNLVLQRQAQ
jgi:hypothetical protein